MNDKVAHNKLKKLNEDRNQSGVGAYRNSRRIKCEQHEIFAEAMSEPEYKRIRKENQ